MNNNEIYFVNNNKIFKGEIQKESKRGTALWIKPINSERKKNMLVSYSKVFNTYGEAKEFIKDKNKIMM